ncbi:MAG: DUF503 domain-containing protein [Thermoleophilia bacterium]
MGVVSADLHLPQGTSLKDKRRELRRLKQRLAQRHGAAVAEVDHHDLWQRARVTAAVVGPDARDVGERVEAMARDLGGDPAFVLLEEAREVRPVEARPTFLDVRGRG